MSQICPWPLPRVSSPVLVSRHQPGQGCHCPESGVRPLLNWVKLIQTQHSQSISSIYQRSFQIELGGLPGLRIRLLLLYWPFDYLLKMNIKASFTCFYLALMLDFSCNAEQRQGTGSGRVLYSCRKLVKSVLYWRLIDPLLTKCWYSYWTSSTQSVNTSNETRSQNS